MFLHLFYVVFVQYLYYYTFIVCMVYLCWTEVLVWNWSVPGQERQDQSGQEKVEVPGVELVGSDVTHLVQKIGLATL